MNNSLEKINAGRSAILMALLVFLVAVLGGCIHSVLSDQTAPSAREIGEQFLQAMDDTFAARDVDAYTNLLHDELTNNITVSQQGRPPQVMSLTKPMMLQVIPQAWSMISNHTIERRDIRVSELENGNLQVENRLMETMTVQRMSVTQETEEAITLVVDGDSVKAIEIVATTSQTMQPPR